MSQETCLGRPKTRLAMMRSQCTFGTFSRIHCSISRRFFCRPSGWVYKSSGIPPESLIRLLLRDRRQHMKAGVSKLVDDIASCFHDLLFVSDLLEGLAYEVGEDSLYACPCTIFKAVAGHALPVIDHGPSFVALRRANNRHASPQSTDRWCNGLYFLPCTG